MNEKYTKEYIYDLLKKAKKVDYEYKVFGADSHKYQLNPPVSIEEVRTFENDFNIQLPDEYVYFLTEIGNGGAGPHYGVYSLEKLRQYQCFGQQDNELSPVIDESLTKEMWNKLIEQMDTDDDLYDAIEEQISIGTINIGTQGCTYDNLLMCKGSEAGKIVYIDWNLEFDYPPFLTKMSFLEWYTGFFEDIIEGCNVHSYGYSKRGTESELKEAYAESVELRDKLDNLQGLMRFGKLTAETIDFLYHVQDTETDRARLAVLLKFQKDLGMKMFDRFINGMNISAAVSVIRGIPEELQQKYYKRAIEILYEKYECDRETLLFFIRDQECKKAVDIIEFAENHEIDSSLKSIAIYVIGKCADAMDYEKCFIKWMKGEDYRIAHTALQAVIATNHRSHALMETFRWMAEKYKTDSVMCNNLKNVL